MPKRAAADDALLQPQQKAPRLSGKILAKTTIAKPTTRDKNKAVRVYRPGETPPVEFKHYVFAAHGDCIVHVKLGLDTDFARITADREVLKKAGGVLATRINMTANEENDSIQITLTDQAAHILVDIIKALHQPSEKSVDTIERLSWVVQCSDRLRIAVPPSFHTDFKWMRTAPMSSLAGWFKTWLNLARRLGRTDVVKTYFDLLVRDMKFWGDDFRFEHYGGLAKVEAEDRNILVAAIECRKEILESVRKQYVVKVSAVTHCQFKMGPIEGCTQSGRCVHFNLGAMTRQMGMMVSQPSDPKDLLRALGTSSIWDHLKRLGTTSEMIKGGLQKQCANEWCDWADWDLEFLMKKTTDAHIEQYWDGLPLDRDSGLP